MTQQTSTRTGRCLCGTVRFSFTPLHEHFDACHCSMCRRWSAGPALAIQADGEPDIEGKAAVIAYASSEWGERHFCGRCGTNLFWRAPDYGYYGVSVGAIDDIEGLAFTKEIFIDHKPGQYAFANDTVHMTEAEVAALFAGPADGDSGSDGDG
ncbi:MAG: GFA family protein [Pseudomonadota bacterium]